MATESPMENMVNFTFLKPFFEGKKVFLTGHTGFKGTWMLQILSMMGARVKGYALAPEHDEDLYHLVQGDTLCEQSVIGDIRNQEQLSEALLDFRPDYIIHMAAQPLVLRGYQDPLYTFEVNTQGTAHVLDALRRLPQDCVSIIVTTDKVYENNDSGASFVESDKLGGYDPYSASKAACEIIISSYRSSYFSTSIPYTKPVVSVRAGNVIGGGDFADHRIVPDIIRAIQNDQVLVLRNPDAIRPWQHVLEPLGIYLLLAARSKQEALRFSKAFNIGPESDDVLTVEELTRLAIEMAGKGTYTIERSETQQHEAAILKLSINKLKHELQWKPKFNAKEAVKETLAWYLSEEEASLKCQKQIQDYFTK